MHIQICFSPRLQLTHFTNPRMHQTNIPQGIILWQKCAHMCTFLLQNVALWDMAEMHSGILWDGSIDPSLARHFPHIFFLSQWSHFGIPKSPETWLFVWQLIQSNSINTKAPHHWPTGHWWIPLIKGQQYGKAFACYDFNLSKFLLLILQ